jgi:membrane associated rhomboid family serine protease
MLRLTPTVKNLLLINLAVYVLHMFTPFDLMGIMALRYVESEAFAPYQFFTYMFAHSDRFFLHILFNMLMLFFMGPLLEMYWGAKRFLTFYLVTGIGAGMIYMGIQYFEMRPFYDRVNAYMEQPDPEAFDIIISRYAPFAYSGLAEFIDGYYDNPTSTAYIQRSRELVRDVTALMSNRSMVGASGAVYGLLMAIALLFPNMEFMLIFPPIPVKAKYLALVLGGIALYSEFNRQEGDMVAHSAHLGGMVFAFIMIKLWQHKGTHFR